jgi:hypothetical protein
VLCGTRRFNALRDLPVPSMIAMSNSWLPGIRFEELGYSIIIAFISEVEDRRCQLSMSWRGGGGGVLTISNSGIGRFRFPSGKNNENRLKVTEAEPEENIGISIGWLKRIYVHNPAPSELSDQNLH